MSKWSVPCQGLENIPGACQELIPDPKVSLMIQEGLSGGTADRVYVHGGRTDEIVASWAGGDWSQHQYDAQGNCILLTDTNGLIREQYDYDAFGFPYVYDRWGYYIGGLPGRNRFLFTGREWIKELRLYDYRNRLGLQKGVRARD